MTKHQLPCMDETQKTFFPQCSKGCSIFVSLTCHGYYPSSDFAIRKSAKLITNKNEHDKKEKD